MPPRFAFPRRSARRSGLFLLALAWASSPLAGQELQLLRDYPGSGRYQCPAPDPVDPPEDADVRRAAQVASDANQAMVLGDFERTQELLAQATDLDPTSADYAFRHALALAEVGDAENALLEYCRALALDIEALGVFDVRDRIDALYETVRERIPAEARDAFVEGLARADSSAYENAVSAFSTAIEAAPEWGAPVYNRGVVYEAMGRVGASLTDYRRYIALAPTDIDPILVIVSERIGQLEGAASVETPSPTGALALGLVPGMGHYYTGRPIMGTLTLATAGGAIAAGMLFRKVTTVCVGVVPPGGMCPSELVVDEITERPYLWYGVGVAATVTLASAIDALVRARARQAEAEAIMGPSDDTGSSNESGPSLALPSIDSDGVRVDLSLLRIRFR